MDTMDTSSQTFFYSFSRILFQSKHPKLSIEASRTRATKEEASIRCGHWIKFLKERDFFNPMFFCEYHISALHGLVSLIAEATTRTQSLANTEEVTDKNLPLVASILHLDERSSEQLLILFACSQDLTWSLIRHHTCIPSLFPVQSESLTDFRERLHSKLIATNPSDEANNEAAALLLCAKQLRLTKLHEFIRIVILDITDEDSLETTVGKISAFADVVVEAALITTGLSQRGLGVMAMGKLGGRELNYSSDIDIMFIADPKIAPRDQDILKRIRSWIALIDDLSSDGRVFRVDLQIRPEGDEGELYLSPKAYRAYYQRRGSHWEYQALIKARYIAGPPSLGKYFEDMRDTLVFGKTFSSEQMLMNIFKMKQRIEEHLTHSQGQKSELLHHKNLRKNFKLGQGGIRDIEFLVQFLQLHHGGLTPALNEIHTLRALKKLFNYKILSAKETVTLTDNYLFLRKIEHRLQIRDFLAIRELPRHTQTLDYLAGLCGYHEPRKSGRFELAYLKATQSTRALFDKIFEHTSLFLTKMKTIEKVLMKKENPAPMDFSSLKQELGKFESDYFLYFSASALVYHIRMLQKISVQDPLHVRVKTNLKNHRISFEVIIYSMVGTFSMIAGHISTKGINILSGFVFSQAHNTEKSTETSHFYRRSFTEWKNQMPYERSKSTHNNTSRQYQHTQSSIRSKEAIMRGEGRKTIVVIKGEFTDAAFQKNFSIETFREELIEYFKLNFNGQGERVREKIYLRALPFLEERRRQTQVSPVLINVDNEAHLFYTTLHIKSQDIFLFLYQFTFSLSERRFRIAKAEFATENSTINNVIYVTERNRQKVTSIHRIEEIKVTLLLLNYFSRYIIFAPNPYLAYLQFSKLVHRIADDADAVLHDLLNERKLFERLARILGTSEAIFEDFFRLEGTELKQILAHKYVLKYSYDEKSLTKSLDDDLHALPSDASLDKRFASLNRFKNKAMFAIDLRFMGGELKIFEAFCLEISALTDVVMRGAYHLLLREQLKKNKRSTPPGEAVLLALGKWGAREMGYCSDVEVIFVYRSAPGQDDAETQQNRNFFEEIGRRLPLAIQSKKNGVFELDFRLRPEGDSGPIAVPFRKFKNYYRAENSHIRNFERMALIRLRPVNGIQGSKVLITDIFAVRDDYVFSTMPFDEEEFIRLRKIQLQQFVKKDKINVKFSLGGLVDIEYFVQRLIIRYGHHAKELRLNHTLKALRALSEYSRTNKHRKKYLLSVQEAKILAEAYRFYRVLINCLRIVRGDAQDLEIPEASSLEFNYLIRRMHAFNSLRLDEDLIEKINSSVHAVISITRPLEKYESLSF